MRVRRGSLRARSPQRRGKLVANLLTGSWRPAPPATTLHPASLERIIPFLLASGCGPLAWGAVRATPRLAPTDGGLALHDAFRHAVIEGAVRERRIVEVVTRLRSEGIEPMLFKGRAAAAAYAEPASRPGGDIDFLVLPEDHARALAVLEQEVRERVVDFSHEHLVPMSERSALFRRAGELRLGGIAVAVPSPEDHLRLVCLHALSHGVARPYWLCDVAAIVESRSDHFDWSLTLSNDPRIAERVRVSLGLARHLVGMRSEGTPVRGRMGPPAWATSAVLRRWADPRNALPHQAWATHRGFRARVGALVRRWPPDPILEAVRNDRRFTRWPRLPHHLADAARRALRVRSAAGESHAE